MPAGVYPTTAGLCIRVKDGQHFLKIFQAQAASDGQFFNLNHVLFYPFQMFLPYQLQICSGYKTAFAGHGGDKAVPFQFFVSPFRGNDADAQFLGQKAHGGQGVALFQLSGDNQVFDLGADLFVYGFIGCIRYNNVQYDPFFPQEDRRRSAGGCSLLM